MFNYQELHCDGLLEFGYVSCNRVYASKEDAGWLMSFNPDWPLVQLAHLVIWANEIRRQALAPMAEYGIQIEIQCRGENEIGIEKAPSPLSPSPVLSSVKFPDYSLHPEETPAALLLTFYRDFWNWLGRDGEGYKEAYGGKDAEIKFEIG